MPNYCFNGIQITYNEDYCNDSYDDIIEDIDFHLRNPIFDEDNVLWDKIKYNRFTKPVEGKYHKFYNEKMDDRTHSKLIKYPLEDTDSIRFSNIVEEPKQYPVKTENGSEIDWFWWRVNNWGTKWDGFDYDNINKTKQDLFISGSTAWSPCKPIVKKLSEIYPEVNIKLEYDEPGCAFCGKVEYNKGELISEITENDFADYRHAAKELEMDDSIVYTCTECKELYYDYEVDDEYNFECECGSHTFLHDHGYYVKTQEEYDLLYGENIDDINYSYDEFFIVKYIV